METLTSWQFIDRLFNNLLFLKNKKESTEGWHVKQWKNLSILTEETCEASMQVSE